MLTFLHAQGKMRETPEQLLVDLVCSQLDPLHLPQYPGLGQHAALVPGTSTEWQKEQKIHPLSSPLCAWISSLKNRGGILSHDLGS